MSDKYQTRDLPSFDNKKVYLIKGSSLNELIDGIRMDLPRVTTGGGLKLDSVNEQGSYLSMIFPAVGTLNVNVCIDGVSVQKTFLLAG